MKNILSFAFSLTLLLPVAASAASFVVTPSSGSYTVGDSIVLNVSANPIGSTIYTAMLDARFSSDTLEASSFSLNDSLLPLKQSGYDALDNTNGILTKTGGFTGGITTTSAFGVIVLRAKVAGTGTFTISDSSKLLDSNNADQQSGAQTISFTIATKPAVVTAPKAQTVIVTKKKEEQAAPSPVNKVTKISEVDSATSSNDLVSTSTQFAAAGKSGTMTNMLWLLAFLSVLISFALGYFAGRRKLRF